MFFLVYSQNVLYKVGVHLLSQQKLSTPAVDSPKYISHPQHILQLYDVAEGKLIRGWVRFLHTMRLLLNVIFPNLKEQCIMPKGVKLLPMADLTLIFVIFASLLKVVVDNTSQ